MKKGFVLIELLLATLIASLIGGILFTALYQTNRFQTVVDNLIDVYTRATIVHNQLERDLMGAFIPVEAQLEKKEEKVPPKRKEIKPINHIFYSRNRNDHLELLTLITNNPMTIFWGAKSGKAKPRVARVRYTIQPEADRKDSFVLLRQEDYELDMSAFKQETKKIRAYEVIDGIKDISVQFTAVIEKKEKENEGKEEKITREYRMLNEWKSEFKDAAEKQKDLPRIPHFVEVKLSLWDNRYQKDVTFVFTFALPVDTEKEESKEKPKKEKPAVKTKTEKQTVKTSQTLIKQEKTKISLHKPRIDIKKQKQSSLNLSNFFHTN